MAILHNVFLINSLQEIFEVSQTGRSFDIRKSNDSLSDTTSSENQERPRIIRSLSAYNRLLTVSEVPRLGCAGIFHGDDNSRVKHREETRASAGLFIAPRLRAGKWLRWIIPYYEPKGPSPVHVAHASKLYLCGREVVDRARSRRGWERLGTPR